MSASGSTAPESGPNPTQGSGSPGRGGPGIDRGAVRLGVGSWFVVGQAREGQGLTFRLGDGVFGACSYLLTGFHGLHVSTGVLLIALMLWRSFRPGNDDGGEAGVTAVGLFWHVVNVIWCDLDRASRAPLPVAGPMSGAR